MTDLLQRISSLSPGKQKLLLQKLGQRKPGENRLGRSLLRTHSGYFPSSFGQRRLWFLDQLEPGSASYNIFTAVRLHGPIDLRLMAQSLAEVMRRHEALRTTFAVIEGEPVQVIAPPAAVDLPLVDLAALPAPECAAQVRPLLGLEGRRSFDLERGPLLRAMVLKLSALEHVLALTVHHIVSDGWSMEILARELKVLYEAYAAGQPSPLPELPLQYADYAAWQRGWLQGEVLATELSYWRRQLDGAPPVLELPADRPRPPVRNGRGASRSLRLSDEVSASLSGLARREGASLFMVLLAAFKALLSRLCGQEDLSLGSPIAGRNRLETEGMVGFFVNTLVLRTDLSGDPQLRTLLARVREVVLGALAHQEMPFDKLVEELNPERSLSYTPLFQVMFDLVQRKAPRVPEGSLRMTPITSGFPQAKFDLSLGLTASGERLAGVLEYATDLFDATTVERLLGHLERLLGGLAADPERRLSELALLSQLEVGQLLWEWNDTASGRGPDFCLHRLFEAQVERSPAATALIWDQGELSYRELDSRADRLASHLRELGVGPDVPVGICVERGPRLLVGILGILKAGGAYLPLDPAYPRDRLAFMMEDSRAPVLLTETRWLGSLPAAGRKVCLDREWEHIPGDGAEDPPEPASLPESLAYLMYTSGSSGRPKGVLVEHRAAAWYAMTAARNYGIQPGERVLHFASISFDISVEEIFPCLTHGATLVLGTGDMLAPDRFLQKCRESEVTTLCMATALWHELSLEVVARPESFPPGLRLVCFGGEKVLPERVSAWRRCVDPRVELLNSYGPTEATVVATLYWISGSGSMPGEVPLGRPIADVRAYVVSPTLALQPAGVAGELWIAGAGLARGYLGRPELTGERFVPDPWGGVGNRCYRTGDRVRWRPAGELEYLGRIDDQVKVRGFRVEPGEIESALAAHPQVLEVAVLAGGGEMAENRRLVAYVVPRSPVEPAGLRDFLARRLPEHMVPSAFVVLDSLPLTPNGKVDRRALPAPVLAVPESSYTAPATPVEKVLAGIWSEVLGLERVGAADHFFELGGHSLLATRVISRARSVFGVDLALRTVFEAPTLRGLAAAIEEALRAGGAEPPPLGPRPDRGEAPLSFAQQRLWFLEQLEPGSSAYNMPTAAWLRGAVRPEVLAAAFSEVVRRHEALRTRFESSEGEPRQVIEAARPVELPLVDLKALPAAQRNRELRRLGREEAERPFDLSRGPLLRASLVRLGEEEHAILLTMHHIVSDGWSTGVLLSELAALYLAFLRGRPSPLPELAIQYADYAWWQRWWLQGAVLERELGYWRGQLAGAPPALELPLDRPRPAVLSGHGASRGVRLGEELSAALSRQARQSGASLFMALLAGFQALLSRLSGQEDVSVGSPIAGRTHVETERLIGFFVNTLVLRTDLSGDPSFGELLGRVRETVFEAHTHQEVPFEKLVEELRPQRSLSHTPLFQVLLVLQNTPEETGAGGTDLVLQALGFENRTAKFELTLTLAETPRGLVGEVEYSTDLFDAVTVERWLGYLERLLGAAVSRPDLRLSELPLLGESERAQVLVEWNDTGAARGGLCLHELIRESARRHPEATALVTGGERLSYRELTERAERLATALRREGVGPEVRVGVMLERSAELVIALLGVLAAGGTYVPLDLSYPAERLEFMVADAAVELVLTSGAEPATPPLPGARRLRVEEALAGPAAVQGARTDPGNLAYLIYTSGSTGRPKAVAIEHRSAVALVAWASETFSARELSGVLASTSISFDLSVFELFVPLALGGTVILAANALELPTLSAREEVRLVNTVPSVMAELLRLGGLPAGVETVNLAGEALSGALAREILRCGRGMRRLLNLYGPSEDTTYSTGSEVGEGPPMIGRPIPGTRAYVLDRRLWPLPVGVTGELYLGGAGLARGYLGRPEVTAERFVPDAWSAEAGARLYRTGDLVRWRMDGELDYLGRIDHQVKVRGFRIELGEIESALLSHPRVAEGVVVAREERPGERRLVAYLVGRGEIETAELRAHLGRRLPEHMVPSAFVGLEALPLTPNGKVDRKALPAPGAEPTTGYVAPRDPLEEAVARVWEEVLGRGPVGATDDFFDLGGHSLLAVRLLALLRRRLGRELPLAALFRASTVERLALALGAANQPSRSSLVEIQGGDGAAPFFCIHPIGGNVLCYLELARLLGPDQPVYGLQRTGSAELTLEELASQYVAVLRDSHPREGYRLGGWSMGGVVAFEMARQLELLGERIEALVLIDAHLAGAREATEPDEATLVQLFARDAAGLAGKRIALAAQGEPLAAALEQAKAAGLVPMDLELAEIEPLYRLFRANFLALQRYQPAGAYNGPALVVRTEQANEGWDGLLAGPVDRHALSADHYSLLRRPHVERLAELIASRLGR